MARGVAVETRFPGHGVPIPAASLQGERLVMASGLDCRKESPFGGLTNEKWFLFRFRAHMRATDLQFARD